MKISAERVGQATGSSDAAITKRKTMAYAAGIGAERDCYLNDLRTDGVIAPPPYVVTLEWAIGNGPKLRSALQADQDMMQASVHVLQDTTFRRPIRPGDALTSTGDIVGIRPTRAGAYVVHRFRTTDSAGDLVAETFSGAIFLRVPVEGEGQATAEPPPLRPERDVVGEGTFVEAIPVARTLGHVYTECAAIWNPIHSELVEARKAHLPDIILQGTCTWALAAERLIDRFGGGDPARLKRLGARFHAMVIPGQPIELRAAQSEDGTVGFAVANAAGDLAITNGVAEFA